MNKQNNKENKVMDGELDYILQALGHQVRRKVIEILAEEGPQTYTELMRKTGVEDSGTFGFHLRRMQKLLVKNNRGEYELSNLGWRAYNILKQLKGEEPKPVKEKEKTREEKVGELTPLVISDRASFELTREMAESYLRRGRRLVITDVLKVIVHPMPRELFDKVVEKISDVLTLHAPKELEDLVHEKTHDVFTIKFYREKPPKTTLDLGGLIGGIVSSIVSGVTSLVTSIVGAATDKAIIIAGRDKLELVSEEPLPVRDYKEITVDVNGGVAEVKHGKQPRIRIWKPRNKLSKAIASVDIGDENIEVEVETGKVELVLPENTKPDKLSVDVNGGAANIEVNQLSQLHLNVNGGWLKTKTSTSKEKLYAKIEVNGGALETTITTTHNTKNQDVKLEVNGGVAKITLNTSANTKIKTSTDIEGGVVNIKLNGTRIPPTYTEPGYEETENKLTISTDIIGGVATININR